MERKLFFVVSALLLLLAAKSFANGSPGVLESIADRGHVNWYTGVIMATGTAAPPEKYLGKPRAADMALQAAQANALRNLLEVAKAVRIDRETTAADSDEAQIRELVKSAETVRREYRSNGKVEVTVAMSLYGGFARLVLPADVKQLPEIKTISSQRTKSLENGQPQGQGAQVAPAADPVNSSTGSKIYTGLVVDARGLKGRPAMSPKIFDENGEEVYGSAYVSREFAVQSGMAGFANDLASSKTNPRVGDAPFIVKSLRTTAPEGSDFVISNSDAATIRSSSHNLSFLRKCSVVIVLD